MFFAITYQRSKAVMFLLAHGADVNVKDNEGTTPLQWATDTSLSLMELLVSKGANVNAADNSGETPLFLAIRQSPSRALYLMEHGAEVNHKNNKCETPLHRAASVYSRASVRHKELVNKLLAAGADVNAVSQEGRTPLDCTIGADVHAVDLEKFPLTLDAQEIRALLKAHGAVPGNHEPATLTSSVLRGADINAQDAEGNTALMRRAMDGKPEAVRVLLAAHARPNIKNREGRTALTMARANNSGGKNVRSVIRLLKQAGAK